MEKQPGEKRRLSQQAVVCAEVLGQERAWDGQSMRLECEKGERVRGLDGGGGGGHKSILVKRPLLKTPRSLPACLEGPSALLRQEFELSNELALAW